MKRLFDIGLSIALIPFATFIMVFIAIAVKVTSKGQVLHMSERVGKHRKNFLMPKVRTMKIDTPQVATHLMKESGNYLTSIGGFLRKTSLDEIPQLWNILKGEMSFVGPRPALFNQDDLVALRLSAGIYELTPGLTGWAQVNGRDDIPIPEKVELEKEYLQKRSFLFDLKVLILTMLKVVGAKGVSH